MAGWNFYLDGARCMPLGTTVNKNKMTAMCFTNIFYIYIYTVISSKTLPQVLTDAEIDNLGLFWD